MFIYYIYLLFITINKHIITIIIIIITIIIIMFYLISGIHSIMFATNKKMETPYITTYSTVIHTNANPIIDRLLEILLLSGGATTKN